MDRARAAVVAALLAIAVVAYWTLRPGVAPKPGAGAPQAAAQNAASRDRDGVDLSDSQLASVKVEPVEEREFPVEKDAIGSIGFNEDMTVQVFTPYQGRIIALFAEVGNDVTKGQTLFTIDSPDLLQAESTLIAAAGVLELNSKNLARLRDLYTTRAVSQHDVEQATSDQQTAEGNLQAARDAVRLFGKTDAEIDSIIAKRSADPTLVVPSPITGRITARHAAPGLYVQPGNEPAPYTVADIKTMWMLANVTETDSPAFRVGQQVQVKVSAFPGRVVRRQDHRDRRNRRSEHPPCPGALGGQRSAARAALRHVRRFRHQRRRAGALAGNCARRRGARRRRHDDGVGHRRPPPFHPAPVTIGQERDGYRQILDGVQTGELVATEGALFLSNTLSTASR